MSGKFDAARAKIQIVFDGPPGHDGGRFVEVEQGGESLVFGDWIQRDDGYWVLELPFSVSDMAILEAAGKVPDPKVAVMIMTDLATVLEKEGRHLWPRWLRDVVIPLLDALPDGGAK
jgi:hypothetical protein